MPHDGLREALEGADKARLDFEPFADRDLDLRAYSRKIVRLRKPARCALSDLTGKEDPEGDAHVIPAGERAVREKGLLEGEWASCYWCLPCIDELLEKEKADGR